MLGKRNVANPQVAFDEAGDGNAVERRARHCSTLLRRAVVLATATRPLVTYLRTSISVSCVLSDILACARYIDSRKVYLDIFSKTILSNMSTLIVILYYPFI